MWRVASAAAVAFMATAAHAAAGTPVVVWDTAAFSQAIGSGSALATAAYSAPDQQSVGAADNWGPFTVSNYNPNFYLPYAWGDSRYCTALVVANGNCISWENGTATVNKFGIYAYLAGSGNFRRGISFDFPAGSTTAFSTEYYDWNDYDGGGNTQPRSHVEVVASNGTVTVVAPPSNPPAGSGNAAYPRGFVGFALSQADIDAGLTLQSVRFIGGNAIADDINNLTTSAEVVGLTGFQSYRTPANVVPVATNVAVAGTPQVGTPVNGTYTYGDANGDPQGTSTYRWVRSATPTPSGGTTVGTAIGYTPVGADTGNYLFFCVTPIATTGANPGVEVCSPAGAPVPAPPVPPVPPAPNVVPVATNVAVGGTPAVGQPLTGIYTYGDADSDPEAGSRYRWVRSDTPSATGGTDVGTAAGYTPGAADAGKYLLFCVTPVAASGANPGAEVCGPAQAVPLPGAPAPVPALGAWGMALLTGLLGAAGLVGSRRRTAASQRR